MKCKHCNADIEQDAQFCPFCGKAVEQGNVCTKCGKPLDDDSEFCPYCGTKQSKVVVESEQVPKVEKSQRPEIAQKVVTEEPSKDVVVNHHQEQDSAQEEETVYSSKPVQNESADSIMTSAENPSPKKWIWILVAILFIGILGGGYYYMSNNYVPGTDSIAETGDSIEPMAPSAAKDFIEGLYKDYNKHEDESSFLSKYFTKDAMQKFYVEDGYDEGSFFYCTSFLTHGDISGGPEPDYGDKVVSRTIEPEGDDWYLVTNIWDVIKDPVIVHLQVKSVYGVLKIVDVKVQDRNESGTEDLAETSTEPVISIEKLRNKSFGEFDEILTLQGFNKIFVPSEREGYGTDVWYKNCEVDKKGEIRDRSTSSCYVEVFDGMNASIRITVFEKELYEQIKSEVLNYSEKKENEYHFKWNDDYSTDFKISMGVGDFIKGGYYVEIPDH